MKKITALILLSTIAFLQSCASPQRSVAQEREASFEEKKHHYPALRRVDRY